MRRIVLTIALIASCMGAMPAHAGDEIYSCTLAGKADDAAKKATNSADCIREQAALIAQQEAALEANSSVIKRVWRIAANPAELVNMLDFSLMRRRETLGGYFQALYEQVLPLDPKVGDDTNSFEALRVKYSDPAVLRADYEANKNTFNAKIATIAVKGIFHDSLAAGFPLFGKPLPLTAASAGEWFSRSCYENDAEMQSDAASCKRLARFAADFKDYYGVDATRGNTYVLAWLYRRHLEGGSKLVSEWQRIGLDLSAEYEAGKPVATR
jgi:hypothetical protein